MQAPTIQSLLEAASTPPTPEKLSSDDIDESTLVLWSRSPERDVYLNRRRLVFTFAVVAVIVALVAALIGQPSASVAEIWWASIVAAVAVVLLCCSAVPYVSARRAFRERQRVMVKARASIALFKMTKSDEIALADLFRYTRRQLDAFIKTARLADEQMNLYYREPHMMGRLVVTERLARTLCESCKKEMEEFMIAQALAWPLPGDEEAKEAKTNASHSPDQKGASRDGT